jgi:PspAA-like protein
MSRKAKTKSRAAASKLKSKGKLRAKKALSARKPAARTRKKAVASRAKAKSAGPAGKKIVRIMGQGQFTVDGKTLKKLNDIDNAIVELVRQERSDDMEFKKRLTELNNMVVKNGKPLDPREIIKSDIILPSADLSIDEAKRLFRGEGVIPEI